MSRKPCMRCTLRHVAFQLMAEGAGDTTDMVNALTDLIAEQIARVDPGLRERCTQLVEGSLALAIEEEIRKYDSRGGDLAHMEAHGHG